ncbi:MAG TPA: hypothetical protein VHE77_01215 [Dongiaceae bacterium]|nr:hypothetical protein [Dongiaceae bacterium]
MLGVIAALAVVAPAYAQSVGARGAEHEDFGRLVLDFTQPVASQIVADGAHMELRLGRAASIDLAGALGNLKTYLKSAKLSADRRRIDLDFTGPVTWNAFNDGTKLAVDFALADESGQQQLDKGPDPASAKLTPAGAPALTAQSKAATPPPLPKVTLRAGEHQGYSRLAFDWPKDVPYQIRQSGDRLDLVFGVPASVDLDGAVGDLPSRLNAIGTDPRPDGVTVHMQTKPDVVVRDFRSGHTVVLDIYDRNAANIPPAKTETPTVASAAPAPAEGLLPVPPEMPMEALTAEPAPGQTIEAGPQPAAPEAGPAPQLQTAMPLPAEAPPAPVAGAGASGPGVAVPITATPPSTFEPPRVPPPPVVVNVTALSAKDGATLYFDWPKPVALAVFKRGNALWLAFDVPGKADLRPLKRLEPMIGKIEQVASPFSLALRLTGGKAGSVTTTTEGARWKVTLLPGNAVSPTRPLQQKRETLPGGGTSLYVQAIASGAAVELKDPGDQARLVVTPEQLPGLGIARESDWPDFKLLASHQGVVVEVLNDATKVQASPNGVVITAPPAGTPVAQAPKPEAPAAAPSAVAAATPTPTPPPGANNPPAAASANGAPPPPATQSSAPVAGLFDLDKWRGSGPDNFQTDLNELKTRMDSASPADRNHARLELAEFYLANGYGIEATGPIEQILKDDGNAKNDPLIMAIGAAAYTMAGDSDNASRLLASPVLKDVPEANLMRAVIAEKQGRTADAAKLFGGPLPDLQPYPKPFRTDARVLATKALLDYGDPLTAQNYLDPLKSDNPDADASARAGYLDGLRLAKLGQKDAAKAAWEKLQDSPVDEIKARSRFALVSQELDDKSIDPAEAAKELEALRFLWRGDTFEFDLLYKLGKLYFDAGQPRRSLITLRQAATHFPDHPLAKQAAADMADEFRQLYLGGAADKLSPMTAVALYDEFRELTPPGAEGDRMIAALADRLVKLDLFDRAGDILERQVRTRLSGADKVEAGTRLAAVRLLDDKPDLALQALKESDDPAGSPDIVAERKRLQARALFDTGDTLKGIGLVRDDASLEGLWLKSDMFWKLKEWPSAAEALGQLIEAEQAKRAAEKAAQTASATDITKNPASVLDKALTQAQAAAAADAANTTPDTTTAPPAPAANGAAAATPPAAGTQSGAQPNANAQPPAPQFDPVLASLVLNRAVALSLANDRRGLKELGRSFGKDMAQSALAEPFQVLTSPDSGLVESITAQMKSVDQLGSFVDEYKKILKSKSLSRTTEPSPDNGPTVPMESPNSGAAPLPGATPQTAEQTPTQQQSSAQ